MRLTTPSCRLGGTILARMKRWPLSGSTVGCVIGLPAFGDGPVWCRKRSRWSMPPSRCLPPTTLMEQRQNSPCHCLLNTLECGSRSQSRQVDFVEVGDDLKRRILRHFGPAVRGLEADCERPVTQVGSKVNLDVLQQLVDVAVAGAAVQTDNERVAHTRDSSGRADDSIGANILVDDVITVRRADVAEVD